MEKLTSLRIKAYGKLNLMLDIAGVREDGYHLLETVMQSVSVYDLLEFELSEGCGIELLCEKAGFPLNEKNLIWKAIIAFYDYCGLHMKEKITVRITKNLPSMAGMAGGSADCAATLIAMNLLHGTKLSDEQLCSIGVKLGADVPFCIMGGTRLCCGIGEEMTELTAPECYFCVVKPDLSISTPMAFKKYDSIENPEKCDTNAFLESLQKGSLFEMCKNMFNVLEYASEEEKIDSAKRHLIRSGALSAMMTGSGSAVFGVFKTEQEACEALKKLDCYDFKAVCRPIDFSYEII